MIESSQREEQRLKLLFFLQDHMSTLGRDFTYHSWTLTESLEMSTHDIGVLSRDLEDIGFLKGRRHSKRARWRTLFLD